MRGIQFFELLKTYRRRFGKRRTDALLRGVFKSDDVKAYDTSYSEDYADYDTLRRTLLTELSK